MGLIINWAQAKVIPHSKIVKPRMAKLGILNAYISIGINLARGVFLISSLAGKGNTHVFKNRSIIDTMDITTTTAVFFPYLL